MKMKGSWIIKLSLKDIYSISQICQSREKQKKNEELSSVTQLLTTPVSFVYSFFPSFFHLSIGYAKYQIQILNTKIQNVFCCVDENLPTFYKHTLNRGDK